MRCLVFALALGLAVVSAACTGNRPPAGALRVQLPGDPISLDPARAEDGISLRVLGNVMEGLVGYDGGGKLQPRLAESWTLSPDGKIFVFRLRPGLRWSDGRPVEAADFVTGLRRSLGPKTGSRLAPMLGAIRGAREFTAGRSSALGVTAREGSVFIELEHPAPYFIHALTIPAAMPSREDVLAAHGGSWPPDSPATGPYRIKSYRQDDRLVLERNPNYCCSRPAIAEVDFLVVSDETTGLNLFERGRLDILTKIPAYDLPRLRKAGVARIDPFPATYYLSFNLRKPPFDDRDLRRAVAGSIRREELVAAFGTGETPARSWVPPGVEGFEPWSDPGPAFADSVARAKARVPREAVAASFDSSSRNSIVMEKVQSDLSRALGLRLSLSNLDWSTYVKSIQTEPSPLFRFGWLTPFLDPVPHLEIFTTGNPNNIPRWSNAEYDELVRAVEAQAPGPEREAKVLAAQRILLEKEAIVVPLYHYVQATAASARVRGYRISPFGVIRFDELSLAE
jgi:oligopeptide transport system substrate-binding protein